jgi:hypothetical protein
MLLKAILNIDPLIRQLKVVEPLKNGSAANSTPLQNILSFPHFHLQRDELNIVLLQAQSEKGRLNAWL